MPKKRGRPPKNKVPEIAVDTQSSHSYEYNTRLSYSVMSEIDDIFNIKGFPYSIEEIRGFLKDPMLHNKELRDASWWAYRANGSVSSTIDYLRSLHTLDKEIVCKQKKSTNFKKNKTKMNLVLDTIKYKQFIRDSILKSANDGIYFYYFETKKAITSNEKFMSDIDVYNIVEINELGINASIIPLPVDYCRIIGRKNSSYISAFDLRYFEQFNDGDRKKKLKAFPQEIRDGWFVYEKKSSQNWLVLDNTKTIIGKIKSAINEPWGIPFSIAALDDILYEDDFTNTKRNVLDEVNNQVFYQTFPEGKEKGTSALTQTQQQEQHDTVKNAIMTKKNANGKGFFSLAGGTKMDKLSIDLSIFDEKNESSIEDNVTKALGVASCILDGNSKGNYATATINLELIASNIYTWISEFVDELNKVVNENIIKDKNCKVELYILPTTFVNRDKQIKYLSDLYTRGKGSLRAWISATGFDSEVYISLMEQELEDDFENRFPVHKTSFTMIGEDSNSSDVDHSAGRPKLDNLTNGNTIKSQTQNGNNNPKPST